MTTEFVAVAAGGVLVADGILVTTAPATFIKTPAGPCVRLDGPVYLAARKDVALDAFVAHAITALSTPETLTTA